MVSADCPVALATQLRSHSRISGTDISVRAGGVAEFSAFESAAAVSGFAFSSDIEGLTHFSSAES
ncbi:hypothetical protein MCNF_52920 [Mycolicibacterium confluentis]|uniref:Uncharacterized protein n=1 Tax=Mycolicibacterium confluentis TaxID=28047 RepID=A0A7I7Y4T7_9MYCO|nr:hypothetical protein MCNF_52920 [Mycolicibacterium confluentis]